MIVNNLLRASRASRSCQRHTVICPSAIVGQMIRNRGKVKELMNLERNVRSDELPASAGRALPVSDIRTCGYGPHDMAATWCLRLVSA